MASHIDRRSHSRQSVELPARVLSNSVGSWQAQLCDLSASGAKLLTVAPIARDEHVVVVLNVADAPRQVVCAGGTAVRVMDLARDTRWGCAVAVEFDAPLGEYAESMVKWLGPTGF